MSDFIKRDILDYEDAKHKAESFSDLCDVVTVGAMAITSQIPRLSILVKLGIMVGEVAADVIVTKVINKKLHKKDFYIAKYGKEAEW